MWDSERDRDHSEPLKTYRVVNRPLLDSLARQAGLAVDREVTTEGEVSGSVKIFAGRAKRAAKRGPLDVGDPRVIRAVVEELRVRGQLVDRRPDRAIDFWNADYRNYYVRETVKMTPVFVPIPEEVRQNAADAVTVWIADPIEPRQQPRDEWDAVGSFVFLVQDRPEVAVPYASHISGISALRMIVDFVIGLDPEESLTAKEMLERRRTEDYFGQNYEKHPTQKFEEVGGRQGRRRLVETVYKVRYMTNEQTAYVGGRYVRMNDIVAYPLYIAD